MKFLYTLLFLFILSVQTSAQSNTNSSQGTIVIDAVIIESINLETVQTINFGNARPTDNVIYINPVNSVNAGYMIASGTADVEFRLTYEPRITLNQVEGSGTLVFSYEISGSQDEDQSTSELLNVENRNSVFNSEGKFYIWVGGRINLRNAEPGNYQGDFTIEIDYI